MVRLLLVLRSITITVTTTGCCRTALPNRLGPRKCQGHYMPSLLSLWVAGQK